MIQLLCYYSQIERLEEERLKLKQNCRQLARQAGIRAAEAGLTGDSVWIDDTGAVRPGSTTADAAIRLAREDYDQQLKDHDHNIDQLRRDLFDKTNENRALITEIRGLEQGLKEIDQQLKQKRFQKTSAGDNSSAYIIQCPSLDKMLQVLEHQSLAGRYDGTMMLKSDNDQLFVHVALCCDFLQRGISSDQTSRSDESRRTARASTRYSLSDEITSRLDGDIPSGSFMDWNARGTAPASSNNFKSRWSFSFYVGKNQRSTSTDHRCPTRSLASLRFTSDFVFSCRALYSSSRNSAMRPSN